LSSGWYVLLVDDDPAISDMYRFGLERKGFRVVVLPDAMKLNETVEAEPPDIVVLDWELPGITGDVALERLRTTPRGRSVPVFMLSNFPGTRNGAIDRTFSAGALAWLEKVNTTPLQLAIRLTEALGDSTSEFAEQGGR
jgi:DNA-binding response OmpR family regulator